MEARFVNDATSFKLLIDAVREVVTEVVLDCSPSGIKMQAMDNSHVALVLFDLDANKAFSHYKCDSSIMFGINVSSLQKVLKLCNNEDVLTIHKNINLDKLDLLFESKSGSKVSQFSLGLLDIDQEQLGIPEVDYQTYVSMSSFEFVRICKEFKELADTLAISSDKTGITFSFNGDTTSGNVKLVPNTFDSTSPLPPVNITVNEPTSASFASKYMMLFSKGSMLSNVVNMSLSKDFPLVLEYKFQEGVLKYFMAPKLEE